jgi:hypothetical protein
VLLSATSVCCYKGHTWSGEGGREHPPCCGLGGLNETASSAAPPWRDCSHDNWWDEVSLLPPTCSYSKLGWKMRSLFRDTPYAGDHSRTINSVEVACS